jgi:phosphoribosylformylglycinamidine synthase
LREGWEQGLLETAHDVSDGGLAVCLAECTLTRPVASPQTAPVGLRVDVPQDHDDVITLFGESASRVVVSCAPEQVEAVATLGRKHGLAVLRLGSTEASGFEVSIAGRPVISLPLAALQNAWQPALEQLLASEVVAS